MIIITWLAAIVGSLDLLPQTTRVIKQGHAHGLSRTSIMLFALDKILNLCVMIALGVGPLVIKYIIGIAYVTILLYYRFRRGV